MKKLIKVSGIIVLLIVLVVGGAASYVKVALPNVGAPQPMKIAYTPERIARGSYLANHVAACMDCHSTRDWSKFSGPLTPGTLGKGGEEFGREFGFPGVYYSRNITPAGISRYTDGELYRVITTGVTKEGKAMFPIMPYTHYGKMDPEDVMDIIAYLRSLPPITNDVAASESDFPMNVIINTIPQKAAGGKRPDPIALVYGDYLANVSACIECHTPANHGQIIPQLAYSGGREFKLPGGGTVRSANITFSTETGIGNWTKEAFINRFKSYGDSNYKAPSVTKGGLNTIMPWTMYAGMTATDLGAIYEFLKRQPVKEHEVVKFSPPVAKKD